MQTYNRQLIFAAACVGLLLFGVGVTTYGSIAPDLKIKFSLDKIAMGGLSALFTIGILVGSLSFGPITDRFGYRLLLATCSLMLALGFTAIGMADVVWMVQIGIVLIGIGGGAINGATSSLVADISTENKGASLALFGSFFGLGALAMPFILGLLKDIVPFETILLVIGGLTFLLTLVYLNLQFPAAKHAQGVSLAQIGQMLRNPALLLIGFFLFWQNACEALINNWATSYLSEELGLNGRWTLYAFSSYVAGLCLMRIVTGSILSKIPATRILRLSMFFLVGGALILGWMSELVWVITGLVLLGFGLALGFPVMFGQSSSLYPQTSGTAIGIILVISLFGNLLTTYLIGHLAENWGIGIFSIALLIATLIQAISCQVVLKKSH